MTLVLYLTDGWCEAEDQGKGMEFRKQVLTWSFHSFMNSHSKWLWSALSVPGADLSTGYVTEQIRQVHPLMELVFIGMVTVDTSQKF